MIDKGAYLTPDNSEKVYPRLVGLVIILGEYVPPPDVSTYSEYCIYCESLPDSISRHIPHRIVHTEEESVSYVRSVPAAAIRAASRMLESRNPTGDIPLTCNIHTSLRTVELASLYALPTSLNSLLCALA